MGQKGLARFSVATALFFLAAFVGIASGQGSPVTIVTFTIAVVVAWTWLTAVSLNTYRLHGDACAPAEAATLP
jgi:hypothetical protein